MKAATQRDETGGGAIRQSSTAAVVRLASADAPAIPHQAVESQSGMRMFQARAFLSRSLLRLALAGRVRWSIALPLRERIGGCL